MNDGRAGGTGSWYLGLLCALCNSAVPAPSTTPSWGCLIPLQFQAGHYQPSSPVDYHAILCSPTVCPVGWQQKLSEWFSKCGLGTPFIRI